MKLASIASRCRSRTRSSLGVLVALTSIQAAVTACCTASTQPGSAPTSAGAAQGAQACDDLVARAIILHRLASPSRRQGRAQHFQFCPFLVRGERQETRNRLYGASDLTRLLSDVGFTEVTAFGWLDAAPYDQDASRLVVVATK